MAAIHALPTHIQNAVLIFSLRQEHDSDFLIFLNDASDFNPSPLPRNLFAWHPRCQVWGEQNFRSILLNRCDCANQRSCGRHAADQALHDGPATDGEFTSLLEVHFDNDRVEWLALRPQQTLLGQGHQLVVENPTT